MKIDLDKNVWGDVNGRMVFALVLAVFTLFLTYIAFYTQHRKRRGFAYPGQLVYAQGMRIGIDAHILVKEHKRYDRRIAQYTEDLILNLRLQPR